MKTPDNFWVDNEHWYKSDLAERMGFKCTQEELDEAKTKDNCFIKQARGVDLYLTVPSSYFNPPKSTKG